MVTIKRLSVNLGPIMTILWPASCVSYWLMFCFVFFPKHVCQRRFLYQKVKDLAEISNYLLQYDPEFLVLQVSRWVKFGPSAPKQLEFLILVFLTLVFLCMSLVVSWLHFHSVFSSFFLVKTPECLQCWEMLSVLELVLVKSAPIWASMLAAASRSVLLLRSCTAACLEPKTTTTAKVNRCRWEKGAACRKFAGFSSKRGQRLLDELHVQTGRKFWLVQVEIFGSEVHQRVTHSGLAVSWMRRSVIISLLI